VKVLFSLAYEPLLEETALSTEKQVVISEIQMAQDQPRRELIHICRKRCGMAIVWVKTLLAGGKTSRTPPKPNSTVSGKS